VSVQVLSRSDTRDAAGRANLPGGQTRRLVRGRGWLRLISPLVIVGLWQLLSSTGVLPPTRLESPVSVAHTAYTLVTTNSPTYGTLQASVLVSAERWGIGFFIGVAIAVALALVSGLIWTGELTVDPVLNLARSVPLFGLLPLFIVWFGIGTLPKIIIVTLGALFPMYVNTFAGIRAVDPKLGELGQVLGLSRWELVRHVVLPGSLPSVFTGLRLSVIGSLLALVVAEQVNANAGLGFMISTAQEFLANNIILVCLVVYAILGVLADAIIRLVERRALTWRREFAQ
jgi:sulfonate transport system permease protein